MSTETALAPLVGADISRQEAARQACEAAGITWPGTILPPGTALYQSGVETLKSDRASWRRLPLASEVIGLVSQALASEDRRDFAADVAELRFRPQDGRLVRRENLENMSVGLGYGDHSLRQLVAQIDPLDDAPRGFASALVYLEDRERAEILNKRIDKMSKSTEMTLRTRLPHEGDGNSRVLRAALSAKYGSVTDEDISMAIAGVLKASDDSTGRLDYKPGDSRSRFEVIWPSEIPVETFVVGDVHYAALSIENSETGEGSVVISPAVIRARCANLTLSIGKGVDVSIRHIGDSAKLIFRLTKAIQAAVDDMVPLLHTITMSAKIPVQTGWSPEKAFAEIARRFSMPKVAAESWTKQLKASNYPESIWGLSAAIQEAAHQQATWTQEADWEKVAATVQARAVEVVSKGTPHGLALEKALAIN